MKIVTALAGLVLCAAAVPAHAGIQYNGYQWNGIRWNGLQLNGTNLNGVSLNGLSPLGFELDASTVTDRAQDIGSDERTHDVKVLAVTLPDAPTSARR